MWGFKTDTDFQIQLDWIEEFVRNEVEPLDYILGSQFDIYDSRFAALVRPLQAVVKSRGLWACHLSPEQGGNGFGQVKLALMNEKFGRSRFGPVVFGSQAPDTGNAEILAHYGTPEQKERWLGPLIENEIVSCFSITEPKGGADPLGFEMQAVFDGNEWVLNGEKWFASNARYASFYIVMAVTDPDAQDRYKRASMFIVPADAPGIEILRNHGYHGEPSPTHGHVRWSDVRVPAANILGARGEAFAVAQARLGGGRMHHAMRTIAEATKCFEMMCERVLSRTTGGEPLSAKQMVQEKIADSWIQLRQFRLLVLETAWLADQGQSWRDLRLNVSAVKATMPKVLHDVAENALQIHGSLGLSTQSPFSDAVILSYMLGLADGPTEVHKTVVAKEALKNFQGTSDLFPSYLAYRQEELAFRKYEDQLNAVELETTAV